MASIQSVGFQRRQCSSKHHPFVRLPTAKSTQSPLFNRFIFSVLTPVFFRMAPMSVSWMRGVDDAEGFHFARKHKPYYYFFHWLKRFSFSFVLRYYFAYAFVSNGLFW